MRGFYLFGSVNDNFTAFVLHNEGSDMRLELFRSLFRTGLAPPPVFAEEDEPQKVCNGAQGRGYIGEGRRGKYLFDSGQFFFA
jgi:hypothetical protein